MNELLGKRVLIEKLKIEEKKSSGGIIIQTEESVLPKYIYGNIYLMSDEIITKLNIGDNVFFNRMKSEEVEIDGQTYYMIHHDDIVGRKNP